jgi:hypothetical protein
MQETFYRLVASVPPLSRFFAPDIPKSAPTIPDTRPPRLEIVSHCWRYSRLLAYQLSSLVLHPPSDVEVRMTVFHAPEDTPTEEVLEYFSALTVPGVHWNPWPLERERLFRRAIGRNLAAQATRADWIWFADCDILAGEGALDRLGAELRRRTDVLVFPREHEVSPLLPPDSPILGGASETFPAVIAVDTSSFTPETRDRAVGGFQIVRGDVARAAGYCANIGFYQRPMPSWRKSYEDRTFRWLLGSQGTPIEVPGFHRIRHEAKGRKGDTPGVA